MNMNEIIYNQSLVFKIKIFQFNFLFHISRNFNWSKIWRITLNIEHQMLARRNINLYKLYIINYIISKQDIL